MNIVKLQQMVPYMMVQLTIVQIKKTFNIKIDLILNLILLLILLMTYQIRQVFKTNQKIQIGVLSARLYESKNRKY